MNTPVTKADLSFLGILKRIFASLFARFKWQFLFVLLMAIIAGGLQALTPKILQQIIDLLLAGTTTPKTFYWLLPIYFFVYLGAAYFNFITGKIVYYLATKIEDAWRYLALHKYYQLPVTWHDQHESGEIGSRIDRAGTAIFSIISELFGHNIIVSLFTLFFILVLTFWQAPIIGAIFLIPLPLYGIVTYVISRRIAKGQARLNKLADRSQRTLFDGCGNARTVKAFGHEEQEVALYAKRWGTYHEQDYRVERLWLRQEIYQTTIEAISRVFLLAFCVYSYMKGVLSVGQIVMFLSYQQLSFSPLTLLTYVFTRVRRLVKRASQLFRIMAEDDPMADVEGAVELPALRNEILFDHVTFKYHGKIETLSDVSFALPSGKTVALVGRSGAGKSTIALLALRFYDPDEGRILWDGIDLRDATRNSLRRRVSYIPQDPTLFNRTIYENIAYSAPHAKKEDVVKAAKLAHAHDFILKTPMGYESVVGERGVKLSGGQRQRIAIARALLAKPSLLIMDESTSHLDSETEKVIQESIRYLHGKTTQLIIAHRLSTILHADLILVIDQGKIAAAGTHEQLLKHPLYKRLYRLQFKG